MIVRNWMQTNPITIPSDTLVSEAKRLLTDNNLHVLPVVDNGRLRGLVTRPNMLRMGHFVMRTQSADEFNFFVNRLKVRDVMVRNPATVRSDDTMVHCLLKGQDLGVAQFPVMDGEEVVGIISANEIFQLAAHCLGAWERHSGVTLAPLKLGPGVLGRIADVVEAAGAVVQAIYPVGRRAKPDDDVFPERTVILRFYPGEIGKVVAALAAAGFPALESAEVRESIL
ncbi:MAG: CBS domain-containing protein [Proteobacteria bacterium]|nr:CBS domain-containing protein [Pseudomonadota bacterium]MBU4581209.1 CBS domain-containing protein [Pseudomonadota bacterium]MCG2739532.1 CBS domain-containing protein [Syntrophaceae bacterium]